MKAVTPIRVLQISAAYPPNRGGVATHVANLAQGLVRRQGFALFVLASTEDTSRVTPKTYRNGPLVVWKRVVEPVANFSGRRAPFDGLLKFILDQWPEVRADIIHAHDFDSVQIGSMLKAAFRKPLVVTIHRVPIPWRHEKHTEDPKDCHLNAIRFYRFADCLVVPSEASRQVLTEQGFKRRSVRVIPHGIRAKYLASFSDRPDILDRLGITPEAKLILCPVRADPHKDPWTFVRAASLLKRSTTQRLVFLVTCDKSQHDYASLEALAVAEKLEVDKDILFRSFYPAEMATLYRRTTVCVVPSRRESFGQTVLESFVFRTPLVAANTTALKEIVVHGRNGLLFTDGSHDDLAAQVLRILDSTTLASDLTREGLRSVLERYDAEKMVDRYQRLYRGLVSQKSTKRQKKGRLPRPPVNMRRNGRQRLI